MMIVCPLLMLLRGIPHPQHRRNAVFAGNDGAVGENAPDVRDEPDGVGKQLRPCRCRQGADEDRIRFHLVELVGRHDDAGDAGHRPGRYRETPQDALLALVVSEVIRTDLSSFCSGGIADGGAMRKRSVRRSRSPGRLGRQIPARAPSSMAACRSALVT